MMDQGKLKHSIVSLSSGMLGEKQYLHKYE